MRTALLVALAASVWAVVGVVVFDSIGIENFEDWERATRWGHITDLKFMASAILSSSILWIAVASIARKNPKTCYSIAALVSPLLGVFLFVGVYWLLSLGDLDVVYALIMILFVFLRAFYFTWPISIGAGLTCYFIARPRAASNQTNRRAE